MKQIWNEGRVVGYSAYEVYVKQHMSEDPNTPPASEREWLASSLAMGSSMIVKINKFNQTVDDDKFTFIEIPMPDNTRLASANTLIASFFDGKCNFKGNFGIKLTDVGPLAQNDNNGSPIENYKYNSPESAFPHRADLSYTQEQLDMLSSYMHIVDGVYVHPGKFIEHSNKPPFKNFGAHIAEPGKLRFSVKGNLKYDVNILITGFTIRSVLSGVCGVDDALNTDHPEDGDFLGPAVFPWASKIIFSIPSSYIAYFDSGAYKRKIETDDKSYLVTHAPVIDMKSKSGSAGTTTPKLDNPVAENYYKTAIPETDQLLFKDKGLQGKKDTRIGDTVHTSNTIGDGQAVLTVYQKKAIYPPALYSTFVASKGENYLHAVDIVAPGSVKVFNNATEQDLIEYEKTFPGTTSMNRRNDGTIQILNQNNKIVSISDIEYVPITNDGNTFRTVYKTYSGTNIPQMIKITSGVKSTYALCLAQNKDITGQPKLQPLPISPHNVMTIEDSSDNLSWSSLIAALYDNVAIDILGHRLKAAKYTLIRERTASQGPFLTFGPTGKGIRLYITDTQPDPTDVPVGSIGIGWGFKQ